MTIFNVFEPEFAKDYFEEHKHKLKNGDQIAQLTNNQLGSMTYRVVVKENGNKTLKLIHTFMDCDTDDDNERSDGGWICKRPRYE